MYDQTMIHYKKRIYGKTIKELKEAFSKNELSYIKLALLFGSRAINKATPKSDYDFAILTHSNIKAPWGIEAKLWSDIPDILNLSECDLDIINLSNASNAILNSIKKGYIILKGSEDELQRVFNSNSKNSQ